MWGQWTNEFYQNPGRTRCGARRYSDLFAINDMTIPMEELTRLNRVEGGIAETGADPPS